MHSTAAAKVDAWFQQHADDGEFAHGDGTAPYTVIGPVGDLGRIIFATKYARVALAISEFPDCSGLGLIGRYGLPSVRDVPWIRDLVGRHEVLFLGDMDPVDLLVLAWLRERLHPKQVAHLGVSDAYLDSLRVVVPEAFAMALSPSEVASCPLLAEVFPGYRDAVGPRCAALLDEGRKIEVEAVVSALGGTSPILLPATDGRR